MLRTPCVVVFLLLASSGFVLAQPCPADVGNIDQGADLSATNYAKTCTVIDGGYVKVNTLYKLHVSAWVTGTCQTYFRNGQNNCVPATFYNRITAGTHQNITGNANGYVVYGNNGVTNYNTCGNGNCTPVNTLANGNTWSTNTLGTYTYSATNQATGGTTGTGIQYCNMSGPYGSNNTVTMNVVSCAPGFNTDASNNILHFDPGPDPNHPITNAVYVPSALVGTGIDDAVTAAVNAWNTTLTSSGIPVQFARVTDLCAGPHCVIVSTGNTGSACASNTISSDPTSGVITSAVGLLVSTNWSGWDTTFNTRTISHELGHMLGLSENLCTSTTSIMGSFSSCGVVMPTTTATVSDQLPVAKTTYGGGTRTSCGF